MSPDSSCHDVDLTVDGAVSLNITEVDSLTDFLNTVAQLVLRLIRANVKLYVWYNSVVCLIFTQGGKTNPAN